MAPSTEPPRQPAGGGIVVRREGPSTDLPVHGTLPVGMSGHILGIGHDPATREGVVHAVELRPGRPATYRSRLVRTDAVARRLGTEQVPGPSSSGPDVIADNIVSFGGFILALGDGALAYELSGDLDTLRRVDIAGQGRGILAFPKRDPITGALHALTAAAPGAQAHITVSSGALTRRSRPIIGAPARLTDVAIAGDSVVFGGDGFVGIASGDAEPDTTWIATGLAGPRLVDASDTGDAVTVLAITPWLERWTLRLGAATIDREVLDPSPRRFAKVGQYSRDRGLRLVWTTGGGTIACHDLAVGRHVHHRLTMSVPGDLVFVPDAARPHDSDGGWLVVFCQDTSGGGELVVIDATDIAHRPIATVRIPARIPHGMRGAWIPSTQP